MQVTLTFDLDNADAKSMIAALSDILGNPMISAPAPVVTTPPARAVAAAVAATAASSKPTAKPPAKAKGKGKAKGSTAAAADAAVPSEETTDVVPTLADLKNHLRETLDTIGEPATREVFKKLKIGKLSDLKGDKAHVKCAAALVAARTVAT